MYKIYNTLKFIKYFLTKNKDRNKIVSNSRGVGYNDKQINF